MFLIVCTRRIEWYSKIENYYLGIQTIGNRYLFSYHRINIDNPSKASCDYNSRIRLFDIQIN
ncbi:hypothetical protein BLOT_004068 [Blomia tropicalis]|nr:hypothetical protein BLOT_004068 [Blomia tropicalis]